ncbi:MAG: hypothetical protein ACYTKC_18970 [Planctomycetota bacterium]|jgi:hypothetical protein
MRDVSLFALLTLLALLASLASPAVVGAQDHPPLRKPVQTPKELWQEFRKDLPPLELQITADRIVASEVDQQVRLRRVDLTFVSQMVFGKKLTHKSVLFLPTDTELAKVAPRKGKGKVVIVGSIAGAMQESFLCNYGHPIATYNRYPVMILPNPGSTPDRPNREWSIRNLWAKGVPRIPTNKYFFRLAVVYLRAMDVCAEVLDIEPAKLRVVIGGHSKRAPSAYNAAAIRPEQVAGVVFMGMEGIWRWQPESPWFPTQPIYIQRFVRCKTIYLGATNEDGYSMFNVTRNQAMLKRRWTVSMVPNYRHAAESEQQFVIWRMWVAHVFDGRPVARIGKVSHEVTATGTRFMAEVACPNRIIQVRAWHTYCDDVPLWRDLVWYPVIMRRNKDGLYEGFERGRTPDAWFVEVHDAAAGFRGYVTSCPQNITGKPVKERRSRGSRSRQWREKEK